MAEGAWCWSGVVVRGLLGVFKATGLSEPRPVTLCSRQHWSRWFGGEGGGGNRGMEEGKVVVVVVRKGRACGK